MKKMFVVLCLLICYSQIANAAPIVRGVSYRGDLDNGRVVTLKGINFGVKNPAAPVLWDDFESSNQSVGSTISAPTIGAYSRVGPTTYSSTDPYAGNYCANSMVRLNSSIEIGLVANWNPNVARDAFMSMKFKILSAYGSVYPHNVKLIRLNTGYPDATHGTPSLNIGSDRGYLNFIGMTNGEVYPGLQYISGFPEIPNPLGWNDISIWNHLGDLDVANGYAGREIGGSISERTNFVNLPTGVLFSGMKSAYFCGYISRDGYDVDLYLDNVYADTTMSRVVIGNNIDYLSCTQREIQIPITWSETGITFTANLGTLLQATSRSLYVFVIDKNNTPSMGYKIYPSFVPKPYIQSVTTAREE